MEVESCVAPIANRTDWSIDQTVDLTEVEKDATVDVYSLGSTRYLNQQIVHSEYAENALWIGGPQPSPLADPLNFKAGELSKDLKLAENACDRNRE